MDLYVLNIQARLNQELRLRRVNDEAAARRSVAAERTDQVPKFITIYHFTLTLCTVLTGTYLILIYNFTFIHNFTNLQYILTLISLSY